MYKTSKRMEIAGSHKLDLDYDSPCQNMHGHNWIIVVEIEGEYLDKNGMLIDFKHIKETVNQFDHVHINDLIGQRLNPTAENMAEIISNTLQQKIEASWEEGDDYYLAPKVSKVSVQESEGNIACFIQ